MRSREMGSRIAVIAGSGRFPFHVAHEARRQGLSLVAVGIKGWADPALAPQVEAYEEFPVEQLGQLIRRLGGPEELLLLVQVLGFTREPAVDSWKPLGEWSSPLGTVWPWPKPSTL